MYVVNKLTSSMYVYPLLGQAFADFMDDIIFLSHSFNSKSILEDDALGRKIWWLSLLGEQGAKSIYMPNSVTYREHWFAHKDIAI